MLMNTLRAALHVVEFITEVATGGPSAAALFEVLNEVRDLQCPCSDCTLQLLRLTCIKVTRISLSLWRRQPASY